MMSFSTPPQRPEWATAKIRMYFATCWYGVEDNQEGPSIEGLHWWDDLLLVVCTWFHQFFVQPFFEREGFPFRVLETYEGFDMSEIDEVPHA
jgi:hypothetical protein